jgi:hypothetical protein
MADQPSPRRRFQFRLRTLLLWATIFAVQCAVCLPGLKEWQRIQRSGPRTFIRSGLRYKIRNVQFTDDQKENHKYSGFL